VKNRKSITKKSRVKHKDTKKLLSQLSEGGNEDTDFGQNDENISGIEEQK
jgi:hypothetical protein